MLKNFKVEFQESEQDTEKDLGILNSDEILQIFDQIDWAGLADAMEEDDLSPTLTIEDEKGGYLWVSVFGTEDHIDFIIEVELQHEIEQSQFFGLFKKKISNAVIHGEVTLAQARQMITFYLNDQHKELYELYENQ